MASIPSPSFGGNILSSIKGTPLTKRSRRPHPADLRPWGCLKDGDRRLLQRKNIEKNTPRVKEERVVRCQ